MGCQQFLLQRLHDLDNRFDLLFAGLGIVHMHQRLQLRARLDQLACVGQLCTTLDLMGEGADFFQFLIKHQLFQATSVLAVGIDQLFYQWPISLWA